MQPATADRGLGLETCRGKSVSILRCMKQANSLDQNCLQRKQQRSVPIEELYSSGLPCEAPKLNLKYIATSNIAVAKEKHCNNGIISYKGSNSNRKYKSKKSNNGYSGTTRNNRST